MIEIFCPACSNKFYTSYPETDIKCPFCDIMLKLGKRNLRSSARFSIKKDFLLLRGADVGAGRTVNLSKNGAGVDVIGFLPFKRDDHLRMVIKDFEFDMSVKVVWVRGTRRKTTRAGLSFVAPFEMSPSC